MQLTFASIQAVFRKGRGKGSRGSSVWGFFSPSWRVGAGILESPLSFEVGSLIHPSHPSALAGGPLEELPLRLPILNWEGGGAGTRGNQLQAAASS